MSLIAISPGDPAGIGPEVCLKALSKNRKNYKKFVLIGDIDHFESLNEKLNLNLKFKIDSKTSGIINVRHIPLAAKVVLGKPNTQNAKYILDVLFEASLGALDKKYSAIITGPINKALINEYGFEFSGHTEFLADISNRKNVVMLLANKVLKVALATTHIPLKEVSKNISAKKLEIILKILIDELKQKWKLKSPKICVLGLNPHAGEKGFLGSEEIEVIKPLIDKLKKNKLNVDGPEPADTAFVPEKLDRYDAFLSMFHDQGLPVLKTLGFGNSVNITLGLPFIRVSVDHGTAYDIAKKFSANDASAQEAIRTSLEMIE